MHSLLNLGKKRLKFTTTNLQLFIGAFKELIKFQYFKEYANNKILS